MNEDGTTRHALDSGTLRAFNELVLELHDPLLPEERLFDVLVDRVGALVPHCSLWVMGADLREQLVTCIFGPWRQQAADLMPAFGRNVQDHPQFMALCAGKALPVDAVSDYVARRKWRGTGMYEEVVKQAGSEDQMSASQMLNGHLTFSLVVNRDGWGFSAQERSVLELLVPHAVQAWRTRTLLRRAGTLTGDAARAGFCFQVLADSWGNVIEAPEGALRWLREAFEERENALSPALPETLRGWMRERLVRVCLGGEAALTGDLALDTRTASGTALHVRLSPGPRYGVHVLAVESRADPAVQGAVLLERELALSRRQAEVLYWLADGKTNEEIAGILDISLFTVKSHLRSVFTVMMVENRHAAAAAAWQVLHPPAPRWEAP